MMTAVASFVSFRVVRSSRLDHVLVFYVFLFAGIAKVSLRSLLKIRFKNKLSCRMMESCIYRAWHLGGLFFSFFPQRNHAAKVVSSGCRGAC